jgi:hypothetical protein
MRPKLAPACAAAVALLWLLAGAGTARALPEREREVAGGLTGLLLTGESALDSAFGIGVDPSGFRNDSEIVLGDVAYPVTGGSFDLVDLSGTVEHLGSLLTFEAPSADLQLRDLLLDGTELRLLADVEVFPSGAPSDPRGVVPFFELRLCAFAGAIDPCLAEDGETVLLAGFGVRVTPEGAAILSDALGAPAAGLEGFDLGVAQVALRFVPEPGTALLLPLALAAFAARARRRGWR